MGNKHMIIPIFVPHKGCPFDCIYCNQKTISGQIDDMNEEKMKLIIDEHIKSSAKNDYIEIGFYGGSFTGIEKEQQINFLKAASEYVKEGKVRDIRLSTRPDYINHDILDYLKYYNVKTIELGVQSLDENVLLKSFRGHTIDDVIKASHQIKEHGFSLGIQTMIGLPGDNRNKDIDTAKKVIELGPDLVRIYPTLVIRNTFLEVMYNKGDYVPPSLEESIDICAELLELYEKNGIKVIRIGLQPTDNINNGADVIAGPFHPAFRQLVESRRTLYKIEKFIKDNELESANGIIVFTGSKFISNVVGQKQSNINYLKERFGYELIRVKVDSSLDNEIHIIPNVKF